MANHRTKSSFIVCSYIQSGLILIRIHFCIRLQFLYQGIICVMMKQATVYQNKYTILLLSCDKPDNK